MKALLLAAGLGTRLYPLTKHWPKCLMPIQGRPLLEFWLESLRNMKLDHVWVNLHYKSEIVKDFLDQSHFSDWVSYIEERELLGTAGTLRHLSNELQDERVMLIHADNLCQCDFQAFLNSHKMRPGKTHISMMTFRTENSQSCGIVKIDDNGIVRELYEKVDDPPGNLANAAVYILEPEIIGWLKKQSERVTDFSTQVLPNFLGEINTWENSNVLRDVGTIESLRDAQTDPVSIKKFRSSSWQKQFKKHSIHKMIHSLDIDAD